LKENEKIQNPNATFKTMHASKLCTVYLQAERNKKNNSIFNKKTIPKNEAIGQFKISIQNINTNYRRHIETVNSRLLEKL
jgi:hypothetical protein